MGDGQLFDFAEPQVICGIDEAGRGPLAGPVCAAAVILGDDFPVEILNDSKVLSEQQRMKAEVVIREKALAYAISWATAKEIDHINILQASLLAMKRAYDKIKKDHPIDLAKVDGNQRPDLDCATIAIVKGDATVPAIMAASILAKNARDRYMVCADKKWPLYGFSKHKGYPTEEHREACLLYGLSPIHRKTFRIKAGAKKKQPDGCLLF
ncbi:ribonuclease HII [Sphaerochaeta pleomorpha str. Grapes]|uniref:Ribonuclease HII n=1 Tax=Sphaerochaeta pleomorpha (strain ATCC BAA-1885 / DSM 22778 / Grapes) TaxID=158190 RepID=G8QWR3_SPHPG|nr:ribonuclease HII [Sphaerochaeta pleomorpha]AEV28357.1 ribonuclease HII [Sphaerochaeta pleomorpha str. Grapes]